MHAGSCWMVSYQTGSILKASFSDYKEKSVVSRNQLSEDQICQSTPGNVMPLSVDLIPLETKYIW